MIARGNPRSVLIKIEYLISPLPILLGVARFIEYKNKKIQRLVSIALIILWVIFPDSHNIFKKLIFNWNECCSRRNMIKGITILLGIIFNF
jgi:hypothetical protein|tara:strand:+ start:297 stop:569 length:273 start_codon:yes stop_codon:yes gene_type:complete